MASTYNSRMPVGLINSLLDYALPLFPGDRELRWSLRQIRYGYRYRVQGLRVVPVDDLRVRKEPTLIAAGSGEAESRFTQPARVVVNPVDRFFPLVGGWEDRRVTHLPHLQVLRDFEANGHLPEDSDYARLLRVRALLQGRTLEENEIRRRLEKVVATWQSIRDEGYLGPGFGRARIVVLENPIHPETPTYRHTGLELFDGHHRAVAAAYLGLSEVQVLTIRGEKVADFDWQAEPVDEELWGRASPGSTSASRT